MQLILDADDIDIKGNMSTIEQESLNEKFLANKIIDHLTDDITSGNKENIQKQDNIITDLSDNDIIDTDKEIATGHVILTNNLNEESSNEAVADTENIEALEDVVSEINSCKTNPEIVRDDPVVGNTIEEKSQFEDNVVLEKQQSSNDVLESSKETETDIISHEITDINNEYSVKKKDNVVEFLIKENVNNLVDIEEKANVKVNTEGKAEKEVNLDNDDAFKVTPEENEEKETHVDKDSAVKATTEANNENQVDVDEDATIKVASKENEEKTIGVHEDDTVKVTTEENEEDQVDVDKDDVIKVVNEEIGKNEVDVDKNDAVEVTTVENENQVNVDEDTSVKVTTDEKKEKQVDANEGNAVEATEDKEYQTEVGGAVDTVTENMEKIDQNNILNTELDNTHKNMEFSINEPKQTNSLNENTPIEIDDEDEKSVEKNNSPNEEILAIDENMEVEDLDEPMEVQDLDENMEGTEGKVISVQETKSLQKDSTTEVLEPKRICKLSNNLDIFSDEEEDSPIAESPKEDQLPQDPTATEKQCINIDDDDDIMLIDEDTNAKDNKKDDGVIDTVSDNIEPVLENTINENLCTEKVQEPETVEEVLPSDTIGPNNTDALQRSTEPEHSVASDVPSTETQEVPVDKVADKKQSKKPLLPKHFIKTCKKNLADMTRDDLEDFCVLKIVESIVDRSNLGEIKLQLKNLAQTMDECKKKCLMLTKQNKDLHVVLKSVQEEQKSVPDMHVTPLKITRSVGMQVVMMIDKTNARKKSVNGLGSPMLPVGNNTNTKQAKPMPNQNARSTKEKMANNQQIPVPRLVPAVTTPKSNQVITNNIIAKHVLINTLANGVRNSPPIQKNTEKRPRSQSVTVDLTDDEPPAKLPTMRSGGVNQTMRVSGTPPNIIPSQRYTPGNINSPRKVYIPISGAQAQNIRPGQKIIVSAIGPRQRCPTPQVAKVPQGANQVRMARQQPNRHPAPLPDAVKQYQPPNWKALPPAPDLKLSKVEHGIVISWKIDSYHEDIHEEIACYQLYAYQETAAPPNTSLWKKIGDVKALPLPMACTLTQFMAGYKYYFAVRPVDVRTRIGPFSLPGSILLLNQM